MKPPKTQKLEYEKVLTGDFVSGIIEKVEYDENRKFKGFEGKEDTVAPAVRFKFKFDGYEFPHYSRWMRFNVGEKANLYKKYISKLVLNPKPDMEFDLDVFNGMKVKTVWSDNGDFQNLDLIAPVGEKIDTTKAFTVADVEDEFVHEDE